MDHDQVDAAGVSELTKKSPRRGDEMTKTKLRDSTYTNDTDMPDTAELTATSAIDTRDSGLSFLRNKVATNAMAWAIAT